MGEQSDISAAASAAWLAAAADLGIAVVAPYRVVSSETESVACVALVEAFGSSTGAIVLDLGSEIPGDQDVVARMGFFVTSINSVAYSQYDRLLFVDTLNDWGWCGPKQDRPSWYTGQPWS